MSKYDAQKMRSVEVKWQKIWADQQLHRAFNPGQPGFDPHKKPFYVLDMFPYPSGSGLHVGHASGYIATDVVARQKRMQGYSVLHPMGWDAFGLPAEQYAIQTNQHPRQTTDVNSANFRRQLKLIGLSYDWSREIDTSHISYYRWTQWVFLQLYKKGLVYRKEMPVWWCEELKTVLANEEVINGRSERGNHPCERRPLTQWVFRITDYADKLLEGLPDLDWPASVKRMQEEWIGKSTGAEIDFEVVGHAQKISVFSTRPDTLFGVTALVLAPEHPLVRQITPESHRQATEHFVQQVRQRSDRERKSEADSVEALFIGAAALHPLTQQPVPILIASYVLADYGTGAVMAVPAHDERDFLLAKKMQLPIPHVVHPTNGPADESKCFTADGIVVNSPAPFKGLTSADAREAIAVELQKRGCGKKQITYRLRDWIFSRQRYWGEPFPLLVDEHGQVHAVDEAQLPVRLPEMQDFKPSLDGSSPLARATDWVQVRGADGKIYQRVTDTMPGWAGSCWYYLRFMDPLNDQQAFSSEAMDYWQQVDLYVGGSSHAVMHLLYARFWHLVLYDLGLVRTREPFKKLFNQGMVTAFAFKDASGRLVPSDDVINRDNVYYRRGSDEPVERFVTKMAKSLRNVINPDDVIAEKGCDAFRLYSMFMGPLEADKPWATDGITGCEKFLRKLWGFLMDEQEHLQLSSTTDERQWKPLHKALKRIDESFGNFNFNTAVAALMEALNELQDNAAPLSHEQCEMLVKMLAPLAPHLAAELWQALGHQDFIDFAAWPTLNTEYLKEADFELVLQVNGKIRKRLRLPIGVSEGDATAKAEAELQEFIAGKAVVKRIYVPNKLVNLVVK